MRWTFVGIPLALAAACGAVPAEERLAKLFVPADRRRVSTIDGMQSRGVDGGFIPVVPVVSSVPAKSGDGSERKRRFLRRFEVVVPKSLQDLPSKRALHCDSGYSLCPDDTCCPTGGDCCSGATCCKKNNRCCSDGGCCPTTHYCDVVDGQPGCCPNGKTCTTSSDTCATSGYVSCSNYDYCCPSGQDCYRTTLGEVLCRVIGSNETDNPAGGGTAVAIQKATSTSTSTSTSPSTSTSTSISTSISSTSTTSSSVPTPTIVATNGAMVVTSGRGGYALLVTAVLYALGPAVEWL